MSKGSPASPRIRYSDSNFLDSKYSSGSAKLRIKNLIIKKIFKLSLKKAKNTLKPAKDPDGEFMENLVSVEREYVRSLINPRFSKNFIFLGNSGEVQNTPERKPYKKIKRKKTSAEHPKHVKRVNTIRRYDSTCSSPLSDKLSRILF